MKTQSTVLGLHFMRCFLVALVATAISRADDWPQWRGADRSNASRETGLLAEWPTNGPPLLWRATGIGLGIHSVSVAGGKVFTVGNREESEFLFALDAKTGEKLWATRVGLGASIRESTLMRWLTQRTPTVDGDRVYALSMNGELLCARTSDGTKLWGVSYSDAFGSRRPVWGFTDHPLVIGERLICTPAGSNASVVALNKLTGELLWKSEPSERMTPGYGALVANEAFGNKHVAAFFGNGIYAYSIADGRLAWRLERPGRTASSWTPLVRGEFVCSPNGYGGGVVGARLIRAGEAVSTQEVYSFSNRLSPFADASALVGEHVYYMEAGQVVCIEFKTGKILWQQRSSASGQIVGMTYVGGQLYIRDAGGTMGLGDASPNGFTNRGGFKIPDFEPSVGTTFPVVAGGRLYLRDNNRLHCFDVSADALKSPRAEPRQVAIGLTARELEESDAPRPPRTGVNRAPDAVFVTTPRDIVEKMFEVAGVKRSDVVVDLGSGDGRFVIIAAKKYGCSAIGYEIDKRLVDLSRESIAKEKLEALARIEHQDIFIQDLSGADVITVFLYPRLMERLIPQFNKLKPGSRIVSHQFDMPGIKPDKVLLFDSKETGEKHKILLWTTPLKRE